MDFDDMTYELQTIFFPNFRERINQQTGKWETISPRRGLIIEGTPCVGSQYTQRMILDETLPKAFHNGICPSSGQDYGFIPDSAAAILDSFPCYDSIFTNGQFSHVEAKNFYSFKWDSKGLIESPFYYPPTPPTQFYYITPGCKTVGLWIRSSSGCVDTFWYHNYKYIADLRPDYNLLDPDSNYKAPLAQEQFCATNNSNNVILKAVPLHIPQKNIVNFKFEAAQIFPGNLTFRDSLTQIYSVNSNEDTAWQLCDTFYINFLTGDTIYQDFITYPLESCDNASLKKIGLSKLRKKWNYVRKTFPLLTLEDTAIIRVKKPGVYSVASIIKNANECTGTMAKDVFVGHYAHFDPDVKGTSRDSVICEGDTVFFWNFNGKDPFSGTMPASKLQFPKYWANDFDLVNFVPIYALKTDYFKNPKGIRAKRNGPGKCTNCPSQVPGFVQYEEVAYDLNDDGYFETKYNIDKLLYESDLDGNGSFETTLQPVDIDHNGKKDTIPYFVYTKGGIYTISLKSTDSTGCTQITKRKDLINVIEAKAYMDTFNAPNVCAPATVHFKSEDTSKVKFAYQYIYNPANPNQIMDSFALDSLVYWEWKVYKVNTNGPDILRGTYYTENPNHVFLENGQYRVELMVRSTSGCIDSTNNPVYVNDPTKQMDIHIGGPEPKFEIIGDKQGCAPFEVKIKDKSESDPTGGRIWNFQWTKADSTYKGSKIFYRKNYPADSIFSFNVQIPGTYYITLILADTVYNSPIGSTYCESPYPPVDTKGKLLYPEDSLKVKVVAFNGFTDTFSVTGPTMVHAGDLKIYRTRLISNIDYSWEVKGGTIVNQVSDHTIQVKWDNVAEGTVTAILGNKNTGCEGRESLKVEITVGMYNINLAEHINIYPNPSFDGMFNFEAKFAKYRSLNISVRNPLGQIVKQVKWQGSKFNDLLDLGNAPSGIYFIEIKDEFGNIGIKRIANMK